MKIVATEIIDLSSLIDESSQTVIFGIDCHGVIYCGATMLSGRPAVPTDRGSFPISQHNSSQEYRMSVFDPIQGNRFVVVKSTLAIHFVQPAPEGLLLVGARCYFRDGKGENNAIHVNWSGEVVREFCLGDGISDVRVAPDLKRIWVSYYDEGIFGNYGWEKPIGTAGLVTFDFLGNVTWEYDYKAANTEPICDSYAFNLHAKSDAWLYRYSEFLITHIKDGEYTNLKPTVSGADCLAVNERGIALVGTYEQFNKINVYKRTNDRLDHLYEASIVDKAGDGIGQFHAMAVGERIVLMSGRKLYELKDWLKVSHD